MIGSLPETFATKGIEYLLVLGFLVALVLFWRLLQPRRVRRAQTPPGPAAGAWFAVPGGVYFHQGHAWARPDEGNVVLAGMDDFAHQLVGEPDRVELPEPGTLLRQGRPAWRLHVQGHAVEVLSPVSGEVLESNAGAGERPAILRNAPYGAGWLVKVRAPEWAAERNHLLSGSLARRWMQETTRALRRLIDPGLGFALQDGGVPVDGIARHLARDGWHELASRFLGGDGTTSCRCRVRGEERART